MNSCNRWELVGIKMLIVFHSGLLQRKWVAIDKYVIEKFKNIWSIPNFSFKSFKILLFITKFYYCWTEPGIGSTWEWLFTRNFWLQILSRWYSSRIMEYIFLIKRIQMNQENPTKSRWIQGISSLNSPGICLNFLNPGESIHEYRWIYS